MENKVNPNVEQWVSYIFIWELIRQGEESSE